MNTTSTPTRRPTHTLTKRTEQNSRCSYLAGKCYLWDTDLRSTGNHTLCKVTCGTCHCTTAQKRLPSFSPTHFPSKEPVNAPSDHPQITAFVSPKEAPTPPTTIYVDDDLFWEYLSWDGQYKSTDSDIRVWIPPYCKATCACCSRSVAPTAIPGITPTELPIKSLINPPTQIPIIIPTNIPASLPTNISTNTLTNILREHPKNYATNIPSQVPSMFPIYMPTVRPTLYTTSAASSSATNFPTDIPAQLPTYIPTTSPSTLTTLSANEYPRTSSTNFQTPRPPTFPTRPTPSPNKSSTTTWNRVTGRCTPEAPKFQTFPTVSQAQIPTNSARSTYSPTMSLSNSLAHSTSDQMLSPKKPTRITKTESPALISSRFTTSPTGSQILRPTMTTRNTVPESPTIGPFNYPKRPPSPIRTEPPTRKPSYVPKRSSTSPLWDLTIPSQSKRSQSPTPSIFLTRPTLSPIQSPPSTLIAVAGSSPPNPSKFPTPLIAYPTQITTVATRSGESPTMSPSTSSTRLTTSSMLSQPIPTRSEMRESPTMSPSKDPTFPTNPTGSKIQCPTTLSLSKTLPIRRGSHILIPTVPSQNWATESPIMSLFGFPKRQTSSILDLTIPSRSKVVETFTLSPTRFSKSSITSAIQSPLILTQYTVTVSPTLGPIKSLTHPASNPIQSRTSTRSTLTETATMSQSNKDREQVAAHYSMPSWAGCLFDLMTLNLERMYLENNSSGNSMCLQQVAIFPTWAWIWIVLT